MIVYESFIPTRNFKKAIQLLELNSKEFPKSFNVYNSLAEVYYMNYQYKKALENYNKVIAINSSNENAISKVKEIKKKLNQ